MPTTLFRTQVEQFLRRTGSGNCTITLADPTTISNISPAPTQVTLDQIYDCFHFSGQALFSALERYTQNEIGKRLPNLLVQQELTLTAGKVEVPSGLERPIEPCLVETSSGVWRDAYLVPHSIINLVKANNSPIRKVSADYPGFYIIGNELFVLPESSLKIKLLAIKSVPRLVLSSRSDVNDVFTGNLGKHLVDGAVMIFKGDSNETALEEFFYKKMQGNFREFSLPIRKQSNPEIEQE